MKRNLLIFTFLILVAAIFLLIFQKENKPTVVIADQTISVTIADTPALRQQGLSGTKSLASNEGMFFVFETPGKYGFWMKDMNYSLDIFWLDPEGKIVHIEENVSPESFPKVFTPSELALYVLEVNAGFAERFGVVPGRLVVLPKPN